MRHAFLPLLLVLPLAAQAPPTFRSETRLVELQVVVTGRDRAPVTGLSAEDFTILENGKRKSIAFFTAPAAQPKRRPEPLPPGLLTNRPEYAPGAPQGIMAVVLDVLNTDMRDRYFARSQVARFLKGLTGSERVGIYVLADRLRLIHSFTEDPLSLARMVQTLRNEWPAASLASEARIRGEADLLWQAMGGQEFDSLLTGIDTQEEMAKELRIRMTLEQLEILGHHLAGVPGRKSLVWVSSGIPMLTVAFSPNLNNPRGSALAYYYRENARFERAVRRLAEANVAVYPVDARGLQVDNLTPVVQPNLGPYGGRGDTAFNRELRRVPAADTFPAMQFLADATGGRALYNTNDLESGLRQAADDLQSNYTLAYYTDLDDDAKKRELNVRVRGRGLDVLARKRVPAARRDGLLEVRDLLDSPIDATGVLLNGRVTRDANQLHVTLQIEPGSLLLSRNGVHTEAIVEIYLAQITPAGQRKVQDARLSLRLTEPELAKLINDGLLYQRTLDLDPETERLRILVRDARSGASGTIDAPIRLVPNEPPPR
ncbi:MAG: VWA domain-containing protein [Bryobacteraceae bacterium]|nr:VWA domain-containing protein [Bryobacteraceae bacterium]